MVLKCQQTGGILVGTSGLLRVLVATTTNTEQIWDFILLFRL